MTLQQTFDRALQHHQAGRLAEAEKLYRQILSDQPNHAESLHFLGVIAHQVGRHDAAVDLMRRAIALRPEWAEAYSNLGIVLKESGRLDEAIAAGRQAIALQPSSPEAHNNLGVSLREKGQLEEAIDTWRRAIELRPNYAEAYANLGLALKDIGRLDEAVAATRQAIELRPNNAEIQYNLGLALDAMGRWDQAIAAYHQAIALKPNYPEAHSDLGNAFRSANRLDEAIARYQQALALRFDYPEVHNNLGVALNEKGKPDAAIAAFRQAIALRPESASAYSNLGNLLLESGKPGDAIPVLRQAIALKPDYAEAMSNLALALMDMGQLDEAIAACRAAIALRSDVPEFHHNLALILLLRGEFAEGWRQHEWRWKVRNFPSTRPNFAQPIWDGSALPDGTIFLYAEQGFGDSIQFIRYISRVVGGCKRVVVRVQPRLRRLFEPISGVTQWLGPDEPVPQFDVHCPLLSLPLIFSTTLETIPGDVPYLHADVEAVARWRSRLADDTSSMKVGLVWAGNPQFKSDRLRSPRQLSLFAPLAEVKNVRFISLQKGEAGKQAKNPPARMQLIDWADELSDFADTAALIANLDLVISSDTSVVHLAGAMGKPVWTLLSAAPDWRWLLERQDSPWYPTMRLFRQETLGDWSGVVEQVRFALEHENLFRITDVSSVSSLRTGRDTK